MQKINWQKVYVWVGIALALFMFWYAILGGYWKYPLLLLIIIFVLLTIWIKPK